MVAMTDLVAYVASITAFMMAGVAVYTVRANRAEIRSRASKTDMEATQLQISLSEDALRMHRDVTSAEISRLRGQLETVQQQNVGLMEASDKLRTLFDRVLDELDEWLIYINGHISPEQRAPLERLRDLRLPK